MSNVKKTLVICCGGTFVMSAQNGKGLQVENFDQIDNAFRRLADRFGKDQVIDFEFLLALDSTDIDTQHWNELATMIASKQAIYRAIIIVCGTNTLAYIASALSFALSGIRIPVILTGAQLPVFEPYSDGPNNFFNSLRVSELNLSGVFVVFGNKIILGSRSKKVSESELNAFDSFNTAPVGMIGTHIRINNRDYIDQLPDKEFDPKYNFESKIVCLTLLPGSNSDLIMSLVDTGYKGIILRSFGSGDIPEIMFRGLSYARKQKVPVINTTQCRGATLMGLNEVGRRALELGLIQAFDMSMEAMSAKMMWLLGQNTPYGQFKQKMHANISGEVNIPGDLE